MDMSAGRPEGPNGCWICMLRYPGGCAVAITTHFGPKPSLWQRLWFGLHGWRYHP